MTLDHRNEPQPGEAERPEAPVIRAWPQQEETGFAPEWLYSMPPRNRPTLPARTITTPAVMLAYLRHHWPGHTIDLSAEPPEGISR